MDKRDSLGQIELTVLAAISRLKEHAYGMSIRRLIEERTGRHVSIGSVYAALDRLKGKGLITFNLSDPVPVRGGRARQYYKIEAPGEVALKRDSNALRGILDGLESVLGGA